MHRQNCMPLNHFREGQKTTLTLTTASISRYQQAQTFSVDLKGEI